MNAVVVIGCGRVGSAVGGESGAVSVAAGVGLASGVARPGMIVTAGGTCRCPVKAYSAHAAMIGMIASTPSGIRR